MENYPSIVTEDIYPSLHPARQTFINPVVLPDDEFVQQWLAVEWEHKPFNPDDHSEYYNRNGVRMHSKEETIISNYLLDRGKPHRYEYPIALKGIGKVHPDFMVLNPRTRKEYFWEHLGLWDDLTYRRMAIQRLVAYQRTGIFPGDQLILTFETANYHPGFYDIHAVIDHYLDLSPAEPDINRAERQTKKRPHCCDLFSELKFSYFVLYGVRSSPRKNTATVPGPEWAAIIGPMSKISMSLIFGKASLISAFSSLAESSSCELQI